MALARSVPRMAPAASAVRSVMAFLGENQPCPWHGASCRHAYAHAMGMQPRRGAGGPPAPDTDYAWEFAASSIRFGAGVTAEVGEDLRASGARRVLVVTDRNIAGIPNGPLATVLASLKKAGVTHSVYDEVRVEPSDKSFKAAIAAAAAYKPDAFIAVGGGSVMDTAKAANLYTSHPSADFLDFVNAPIGKGKPVPGPVKPLYAVPTTAGTGSETTGVAIFDYEPLHAKTGIASRVIKPTLGLVDPRNTASMPAPVAAASGFDVLCHALESYTAIPFNKRSPRPASPAVRPTYQGANPIADVWATYALRLISRYFIRSVKDRLDEEANAAMTLAATYAGVGFGNAGVHLCHGMSYPISGLNKAYVHPGYDPKKPLVPHGISVVMSSPAIFRWTAAADPGRHAEAAALLRGDNPPVSLRMYTSEDDRVAVGAGRVSATAAADAGNALADQLLRYMDIMRVPDGLGALGFTNADVPALVEGTLPQKRVTNLSPHPVASEHLAQLFRASMKVY